MAINDFVEDILLLPFYGEIIPFSECFCSNFHERKIITSFLVFFVPIFMGIEDNYVVSYF